MDFFILALATFRISSLIADEDGPFGVFEWTRGKIGAKRDDKGANYGTNNFAVGVTCIWCNSIWIAAVIKGSDMYQHTITLIVLFPFALSAVALIIAEITKALQRHADG